MPNLSLSRFCLSMTVAVILATMQAGQARGLLARPSQGEAEISRQRAAEAARHAESAAAKVQAATPAPVQNQAVAEPTATSAVKSAVEATTKVTPPAAPAPVAADLEQRLKAEQQARREAEAASQQKLSELEARLQAEREEAARAVAETQKRLAELEARLQAEQAAKPSQPEPPREAAAAKTDAAPVAAAASEPPVKKRTALLNPFKDKEKAGEDANHEYTITAERMEMANNVIELNGNVKIEDETMLMTAEKMLVYLQDTDASADRLEKAEAFGAVTIRKLDGDESATGDRGTFDKVQGTIVLDGNCTLMQGKNVMQCRTIIYDLNSQKIKAIGATLNLQTGKGAGGQADFFGLGGGETRETPETDSKK